jgi:uncharacterized protein YerC
MSARTFSLALIFCAAPLAAQETRITRGALPPAVERAVAQQSQGATIRGFSREVEHGQTTYEMELTVAGHSKDVTMDSTGAVIELEEQVVLDSLAAAVQQAIKAQAGTATIGRVERLTKGDKVVAYEAHVSVNGKGREIQVGPNGEKLDHEE